MKKLFYVLITVFIASSSYAEELSFDSTQFIDCFEKAYNQRIQELKEEDPEAYSEDVLCSGLSADSKAKVQRLYAFYEMDPLEDNIREHYLMLTLHYKRHFESSGISCFNYPFYVGGGIRENYANTDLVSDAINIMLERDYSKSMSDRPLKNYPQNLINSCGL